MPDPYIDIGSLRHRITLLQSGTARDSSGQLVAPTLFATCWASVDPMSGQQIYRAQQFTSDANIQIVMRYMPGVLPNMTIEFEGRTFVILVPLDEQSMKVKLTLLCKEIL